MTHEYESVRRVAYGDWSFVPVCDQCGRFVKADKRLELVGELPTDKPNATCKRCGRVQMLCEGCV